jgi:hypothetical protein
MQKSNFKGRETVKTHFDKKEESFGRLKREIGVVVETTRPIFERDDGRESKGSKQVDIIFVRGRGRLAVTVEEAKWMREQLDEALHAGADAERVVQEERAAWEAERAQSTEQWKQDLQSTPGGKGRGTRRTGKTERKKKKGKAGEAYHRSKKAEKSQRSREERNRMQSSGGKR